MMVAKSYYNAAHFAESFQRLDDLRASGETCDIRLLASNKEISAHKLVLASVSEYFKNAIYGLFLKDSSKDELEFKEIQHEILSALVNYIYSGKIDINSENVYAIYDAADYCLMNFLKEMCIDFLQENLDVDNCVKIWIMANNFKHEKLGIAAQNFIFSNLVLVSDTKEFLSLSNEEILNCFKLLPKHDLFDSIITVALKWATDKGNREETIINIFKDIPHTNISEDYLENFLSKNEVIENSIGCNKWLMHIYKEKSKFHKLKQAETEAKLKSENEKLKLKQAETEAKLKAAELKTELKFNGFIYNLPIILMDNGDDESHTFYKYNRLNDEISFYNKTRGINYIAFDCATYKNYIYVVVNKYCERFAYDDLNRNRYDPVFYHQHSLGSRAVVLNDSMYIFGGISNRMTASSVDLNTCQGTSFSLLHGRWEAGLAVCDGAIYICGGEADIVERFDPREGRTTQLAIISDNYFLGSCSAATLSNMIYCTNGKEYKMLDLRNNRCIDIEPVLGEDARCLFSSYGKLHVITEKTIYEYNEVFANWQALASFPVLSIIKRAISF